MPEVTEFGVAAAADALRRGELTAEDYASALLARAAERADLNAFIHHDSDAVREAARRADARRKAGEPLGSLHGVPLALKDNVDVAGLPTTAGTPGLKGNCPQRSAPAAQKLIDAGALLFGKANMHELAFGITNNNAAFGPVRNPYDPTRIPGGSSGGTAVAVAARIVPGGIGTDTGGSVRIPAALCGVTGFRPTLGRWSQAGIVPISHTRDTPGPIARSVSDCALLDAVVTGALASAPVNLKGLRLGVPREYFWAPLERELSRVLEEALACLRAAGATLIEADIAGIGAIDSAASLPIALYESVTDLEVYLASHGIAGGFAQLVAKTASPDVQGILSSQLGADAVSEPAYRKALSTHRVRLQDAYKRYFTEQRVDAIVFPTTPLPAAKIGEDENVLLDGVLSPTFMTFIRNTDPGSVAGIPGLSLPAGVTPEGLPVGIELDAPQGTDAHLLGIGLALEAVLPKISAPRF